MLQLQVDLDGDRTRRLATLDQSEMQDAEVYAVQPGEIEKIKQEHAEALAAMEKKQEFNRRKHKAAIEKRLKARQRRLDQAREMERMAKERWRRR